MGKRPQLIILTGEMAGKVIDVPDGGLRLGRSSSNDIHIPDEELSRNHCLFEPDGFDAIRVVDLASANGTFVNSEQLGADAKTLKTGDVIEVGRTALKVVEENFKTVISTPGNLPNAEPPAAITSPVKPDGEKPPAPKAPPASGSIDLGLGGDARGEESAADAEGGAVEGKRNSARANILWGLVALVGAATIALMLLMPTSDAGSGNALDGVAESGEKPAPSVTELRYERIDANQKHILRSYIVIDGNGDISSEYDDVPSENRHVKSEPKRLSDDARKRLAEIFDDDEWRALKPPYTGDRASDVNSLRSWKICTIAGDSFREVLVENTSEPPAFRKVREQLEALLNTELESWDLIRSREELVALAKESEALADQKWEERDVEVGNLAKAVYEYRMACNYLKSFEQDAQRRRCEEKRDKALKELDERYRERKFNVDRAYKMENWAQARDELRTIIEMLPLELMPRQDDPRHTEAKAKLIEVERRLDPRKKRKGKSKGGAK